MILRLTKLLSIVVVVVSITLIATRPDFERYLKQNAPGNPRPDAFNGLNNAIPIFMTFVSATLVLATIIQMMHSKLLLLPLLFGPMVCFGGWTLVENWSDPNWSQLFGIMIVGMFVSCLVTSFLMLARRNLADREA
jgi:hypothetical protein